MTPGRLVVSGFIVLYLVSATVIAIPPPLGMGRMRGERLSPDDRLARLVRPTLDTIQPFTEGVTAAVWRTAAPVRRALLPLVRQVRLAQSWQMFAQPARENTFLAVRVEGIRPDGGAVASALQVLPGLDATQFRGLSFFQERYKDKALSNSVYSWRRMRREFPSRSAEGETDFGPDVFGRIARYFGPRVARLLPRDAVLARTEVWEGARPMAARGYADDITPLPDLGTLPYGGRPGMSVGSGGSTWELRRVIEAPR